MTPADADRSAEPLRVILSYPHRRVRGFVDRENWPRIRSAFPSSPLFWFRPLDETLTSDGGVEFLPLEGAKALFVVRSFEGERDHDTIFFHEDVTPPEWLWVKLTFTDGEVLEGMIDNEAGFLLNDGFLLHPTDPAGNNLMVYVLKAHMRDFQVLGLRQRFRRATNMLDEDRVGTGGSAST